MKKYLMQQLTVVALCHTFLEVACWITFSGVQIRSACVGVGFEVATGLIKQVSCHDTCLVAPTFYDNLNTSYLVF